MSIYLEISEAYQKPRPVSTIDDWMELEGIILIHFFCTTIYLRFVFFYKLPISIKKRDKSLAKSREGTINVWKTGGKKEKYILGKERSGPVQAYMH